MDFHRRQIRVFTVLLGRIKRREKPGASDNSMKSSNGEEPSQPSATLDHLAASPARILASPQQINTSARKFPAAKKIVEQRTPPITTSQSRARKPPRHRRPIPPHPIPPPPTS